MVGLSDLATSKLTLGDLCLWKNNDCYAMSHNSPWNSFTEEVIPRIYRVLSRFKLSLFSPCKYICFILFKCSLTTVCRRGPVHIYSDLFTYILLLLFSDAEFCCNSLNSPSNLINYAFMSRPFDLASCEGHRCSDWCSSFYVVFVRFEIHNISGATFINGTFVTWKVLMLCMWIKYELIP